VNIFVKNKSCIYHSYIIINHKLRIYVPMPITHRYFAINFTNSWKVGVERTVEGTIILNITYKQKQLQPGESVTLRYAPWSYAGLPGNLGRHVHRSFSII